MSVDFERLTALDCTEIAERGLPFVFRAFPEAGLHGSFGRRQRPQECGGPGSRVYPQPALRLNRRDHAMQMQGGRFFLRTAMCPTTCCCSCCSATAVLARSRRNAGLIYFVSVVHDFRRGNNSLGSALKTCYVWAAFVALVTPLDSIEGAASSHLRPFLLYGWRRSRSTNSLKEK
jgi:hypothetical protein